MKENNTYQGNELELFQHATRWKKYFSHVIRPYLGKTVLEAGAGLGATTLLLNNGTAKQWLLLEPDPSMAQLLQQKVTTAGLPSNCTVLNGTIRNVQGQFSSIIYIDVLEHIEADKEELARAATRLAPGGYLVVLSPAFPSLFSPFDKAIGHYRRYTRRMLNQLTPTGLSVVHHRYYDSVGYFASLCNRLLLRKKYPTQQQVLFWDRWMVPVSRITDRLFFHQFGKSIIAIWQKEPDR